MKQQQIELEARKRFTEGDCSHGDCYMAEQCRTVKYCLRFKYAKEAENAATGVQHGDDGQSAGA